MRTCNSMTKLEIEKITKGLPLLLILLLSACGGNTKVTATIPPVVTDPDQQVTVHAKELRKIMTDHFGHVNLLLTDDNYTLPDNGKIAQLNNSGHCKPHTNDVTEHSDWDCDDYSIAAMAPMKHYAFGTMYVKTEEGRRHTLNVFVNCKKEVKYWEPQTCDYYQGRFHKPEVILF